MIVYIVTNQDGEILAVYSSALKACDAAIDHAFKSYVGKPIAESHTYGAHTVGYNGPDGEFFVTSSPVQ